MNNYFGIGLDAKIALEFDQKRELHGDKARLGMCTKFPTVCRGKTSEEE